MYQDKFKDITAAY